jgi:hypothetical protein
MYCKRIRANPRLKGTNWFDTVFVTVSDDDLENLFMLGMLVARVVLFFSFHDRRLRENIPCALVNWVVPTTESPDPSTGTCGMCHR